MSGIGVLREGPLHAAVKDLLARPGDRAEVPFGRYVIDLVRADGELVEIQTGGFSPLGPKLDALLDGHRMRIVHPVAGASGGSCASTRTARCCRRGGRRCAAGRWTSSTGSCRSRRCSRIRT